MKKPYWIGLDVHCKSCEFATATPTGRLIDRRPVPTTIPDLARAIDPVRRPRILVFEEGPLADWLYRHLRDRVDQTIVCDPRRNHLIAKDGDKDDPIDVEKLLNLARGGFVREVHHTDSESRSIFKQHVGLYHDRVRHKVRETNHLIGILRRFGVVVRERAFADDAPCKRAELLNQLPARKTIRADIQLLMESYDLAVRHVQIAQRRLIQLARPIDQIGRFIEVPGVRWVRASTFFAHIDTPWRFKNKSSLWKYMGIGLERRRSGSGPERLGVPKRANWVLKNVILGAAQSAVVTGNNPFADQHERWLHNGCAPRIARRNVARSLAAVMWGMWKSQCEYRPELVGQAARIIDD